eukprot:3367413-Rhodomonas_salina.1
MKDKKRCLLLFGPKGLGRKERDITRASDIPREAREKGTKYRKYIPHASNMHQTYREVEHGGCALKSRLACDFWREHHLDPAPIAIPISETSPRPSTNPNPKNLRDTTDAHPRGMHDACAMYM